MSAGSTRLAPRRGEGMHRLSNRTLTALATMALAMVAVLLVAGPSAAAETKIRVWTDKDRKVAVEKVVSAWAASKGLTVEVVEKDFGKIRDDLKTVQAESAPDVI